MTLESTSSGLVASQGYDPATQTLAIVTTKTPETVYYYAGVLPATYAEFLAAPSMGIYWGQRINRCYSTTSEPVEAMGDPGQGRR